MCDGRYHHSIPWPAWVVRHLDLLTNAETRYRSLRGRHTEQLVLIGAVNRIATASLTLESLLDRTPGRCSGADADEPLVARMRAVRDAIVRLRHAVAARQSVGDGAFARLDAPPPLVGRDLPFLPSLLDIERALADVPAATGFLDPNGNSFWGRPTDVMLMPDGSVLVSDEQNGALLRVSYAK